MGLFALIYGIVCLEAQFCQQAAPQGLPPSLWGMLKREALTVRWDFPRSLTGTQ